MIFPEQRRLRLAVKRNTVQVLAVAEPANRNPMRQQGDKRYQRQTKIGYPLNAKSDGVVS